MISNSDNDAVSLLKRKCQPGYLPQLVAHLQIDAPSPGSAEYFINPMSMSKFFRVLYNGVYLGPKMSELGLDMLNALRFQNGIVAGLDSGLVVAHKFGERMMGNSAQLHEFAIVYDGGNPYLLGIMSSGTNLNELSEILKHISGLIYRGAEIMLLQVDFVIPHFAMMRPACFRNFF